MEASHPLNSALSDLARAFPRGGITVGTLRVYSRELEDLPVDAVVGACRSLIRGSEFFPTIHAIREAVAERTLSLPSETDALAQVNTRSLSRVADGEVITLPPLHPLIREALEAVGGIHAFRTSHEPSVIRGQFCRYYRDLRAGRIREATIGDVTALEPGPKLRELTA